MPLIISETETRRVVQRQVPSRYGGTYPKSIVSVKCCGEWLECDAFTTTCDHCHADYNWTGARLAPRSQWGEDTGEHWSDCY